MAAAGGRRREGEGGGRGGDSLLPKTYEEFGTKQYWEDFFKQREEKAFEWYGAYRELSEFVTPVVGQDDRVLVIGCGNSDFSTDMYLRGGHRHITNVDFSESVIEEMRSKTATTCPRMLWRVMDVTAMSFADGEWDAVVDKGTLDAIYNTEENEPQADLMLDEVERVLAPVGGRYLVVTLGQDFIFRKLLQRFGGGGWSLSVHALEAKTGPRPDAGSPFLTLVAVATRQQPHDAITPAVTLTFDSTAKWVTKPLAFDDHEAVLAHVVAAREWHHTRHQLQSIKPGRFKGDVDIYMRESSEEASARAAGPRYTLSIVDIIPPTRTPDSCAVFIIPQDRNHEWLFSSADGLRQVAEGSQYERLICVRMNRGHKFTDLEEVKGELGAIVTDFFPANMKSSYLVPYLAVGAVDDGSRVEVDRGELPLCGAYCVEEEEDQDGPSGSLLRRLIFLRNQHVIQTEVRMAPPKESSSSGGGGKKKKGGGSKKGVSKGTSKETEGEAGPAAMLLSMVMDFSYMCFDYHRAMLSGLWLIGPTLKAARSEGRRLRCLVLGLGGGALPLFLSHYYPGVLDIVVMELEGGLRHVATNWFGFKEQEGLRVEVGDGLDKVFKGAETEPGSYDVIMVDVDNKDASIGISCPGPDFLTKTFLQATRRLLKPSPGLLVMNLAARSSEAREAAMKGFRDIFTGDGGNGGDGGGDGGGGEVLEIHPSDEDVNHVIFGLNTPRSSTKTSTLALGLEKWLQAGSAGASGADPLELVDLLSKVTSLKA